MAELNHLIEELVTGNRILAREGVVEFLRPYQRSASG